MYNQSDEYRGGALQEEAGSFDFDPAALLQVIVRRKWIVLATFVITVAIGLMWLLRAPNVYLAEAHVVIKKEAPKVLGSGVEDMTADRSFGYMANNFYETEYRIIKSMPVAQQVVTNLGLEKDELERDVKVYLSSSEGKAELDRVWPKELAERLALVGVNLSSNADSLLKTIRGLNPAESIQGRIQVDPVKRSNLVKIVITGADPERVALLANAVAEAYIQVNLSKKVKTSSSAVAWLAEQVDDLRNQLESSELALHEFKLKHNIISVSLEDKQSLIAQSLSHLSKELLTEKAARIRAESQLQQMQRLVESGQPLSKLNFVVPVGAVESLEAELYKLEQQAVELSLRYTSQHPKVIANNAELISVKKAIRSEIEKAIAAKQNLYKTALETERRLQTEIDEVKQQALLLNEREIEYFRLARESKQNNQLYAMVLKRQKEAELTQMLKVNNLSLLQEATPNSGPISPRRKTALTVIFLVALALAIGAALVAEWFDNTAKTQEQLESQLGLSFLGILPLIRQTSGAGMEPSQRDLFIVENPRSSVAECSRSIRTNLLFMATDKPAQTLLVTSSRPKEGKTTAAINLSVAVAQAGSRTLLIDADMRRPRLHRSFNLPNEQGLTSALVGNDRLEDLIVRTSVDNLDLLTCGAIPPNPAELLHTNAFLNLLDELKKRYDRIVFDTPPVGAVTDAVILGSMVDGVVFITKAHETVMPVAQEAVRQLRGVGSNLMGVVLNKVDLDENRGGKYYQYYRYYRQGYYYQDDTEDTDNSQAA